MVGKDDYNDPLSEHAILTGHDINAGAGSASGGIDTSQRVGVRRMDEASRPSHVRGADKNAPAPTSAAGSTPHEEGNPVVEGLRSSGKSSAGIGDVDREPGQA